ncbi:VOC family protein [Marisediminicola antarctica]|uniref:Glyoxalase n=1 Tax=Marisediminicola antarctica TaxID=674079 RepID=A0A7L5AN98_9MICO|nr:glyoxalase [Marisediminicola antarctica]QHO70621.1 glyoxalase [Marisediminicola antarctica]
MPTSIFVNLPVGDLDRSRGFFAALGYGFAPEFADENSLCVVISDSIFVMLLLEPYFASFTNKPTADAASVAEVILTVSVDSRDEVDRLADTALESGGTSSSAQDMGIMYSRSIQDPDGHIWEFMWMDPGHAEEPDERD